jgi:hypothetical protein
VHRYAQADGLPPNALHFYTIQLSDGRIYVGFEYGFAEFLPDAKAHEPKFRVFVREKVNALAEDAGGALWIGTDTKGAWKLAPTGFMMFGEDDGLPPSDELMSVFPDREDGVYVVSRPNKLSHLAHGRAERVTPFGLKNRSWGWHFLDLVTALNPKSITFFVAFLPQFLNPRADFATQMLVLESTFLVLCSINAFSYALVASKARGFIRNRRTVRVVNRVGGGLLIGAGLATASMRRAHG